MLFSLDYEIPMSTAQANNRCSKSCVKVRYFEIPEIWHLCENSNESGARSKKSEPIFQGNFLEVGLTFTI